MILILVRVFSFLVSNNLLCLGSIMLIIVKEIVCEEVVWDCIMFNVLVFVEFILMLNLVFLKWLRMCLMSSLLFLINKIWIVICFNFIFDLLLC